MDSLRTACTDPESLFSLPVEGLLHLVHNAFPEDIDRLQRAYSIRGSCWNPPATPSPSYILYGENYDEVNRTLIGFLALCWIHKGEYESFIGSHPSEARLTRASFEWIRSFYTQTVVTPNDLFTLIVSIIVNDLGKDPQLASDYHELTGEDISDLNHDAILLKACSAGLVKSLASLSIQDKNDVVRSLHLGASFNFGQLAQAENAPACLSGLLQMKGRPRSFQLRFLEQLLDIAGAAGHMDWTCAKKLNQPIFDAYRNVYDACQGVITGSLDLRAAYDLVLFRRVGLLESRGYRKLQVEENEDDRALTRLLCMGGVGDLETARLYENAWRHLEKPIRDNLVHSLNVDGSKVEPAIQPTYMPALISRAKDEKSLTCVMVYLARVMSATNIAYSSSAVVIERSVLGIMKKNVENGEFEQDPAVLEGVDVPPAAVALSEQDSWR
ncbi:uncharacterized protein TRUGW13939_10489 [Talaromyces rugulosus]|uniref:Uncharacterized protein n=1 Tax=Talaromyces rugulosus TaxID=121627 RepID=A0A7H8RA54_TALRU|nr:uncharacterized protein TRUGW13939_10489 [Talaromyces rugulosus]QKX63319.1 hypothetical protein TRUGW13939_10489 [Talaromyces rugulosus]